MNSFGKLLFFCRFSPADKEIEKRILFNVYNNSKCPGRTRRNRMKAKKGEINSLNDKSAIADSKVNIKNECNYKELIAKLKQLYSVKGVKTFRGHEGIGYNASLYKGKKKIAFVIDDASGGDSHIEEEDIEAVKELELACANVGLVPRSYPGWKDWESKYDIREFIGDLVNDYEDKKRIKKKESK